MARLPPQDTPGRGACQSGRAAVGVGEYDPAPLNDQK